MWSWLVTAFLVLVALVALYVWYMSKKNGELRRFGIEGPKTYPVVGSLRGSSFIQDSVKNYHEYKDKKIYATYFARQSMFNITDLDMIRDVMTRHFNSFPDRQESPKMGNCMDYMLTVLNGDKWKHVRSQLSPTFSSGKIKRMSKLIEITSQNMVENLTEKMERNEPVELREVMQTFTMDAIANTAFGLDINSVKDPSNPFITQAKSLMDSLGKVLFLFMFAPFIIPLLRFLRIPIWNATAIDFFTTFTEKAMEERQSVDPSLKKRNDFLQVLIEAEKDNKEEDKNGDEKGKEGEKTFHGLTNMEIQASALIFILAGYDTVSRVMSFTLFLLAMNPEHLTLVQEELDDKLGSEAPNYDNVANLNYLDMCLNEAMRLYPPGFILQRKCVEDTEIQGFTFPKDYLVNIPTFSIHRDPAYWEDPEKFDPERFTQERKESRHQYAFMPFGYGPRNCIGMRLAQLEMKLGLAAILQKLVPVSCEKTVWPIKLEGMQMQAVDGLWVKMERRSSPIVN